jgi:hypothetical protein
MSPVTICFVAFLFILGSAFAGMLLKDVIPEHLLSEDSKKIIESARGVVVGLAALTLGLLIATAKTSFDTKSIELKEASAKMIALNRMLIRYGNESQKARDSLRQVATSGIEIIDKIGKEGFTPRATGAERLDEFMTNLMDLPEHNASQSLSGEFLNHSNHL